MQHERQALTALAFSGVVGPRRFADLAEVFGTAEKIIQADRNQFCEIIGEKAGNKLYEAVDSFSFDQLEEIMLRKNMQLVTRADEDYPQRLKLIADPPLVLFYKGKYKPGEQPVALAVVGARKASAYGLTWAKKISCELADAGVHIVSGMAYGVDSEAHKGALLAKSATTAVLGCGADVCYPAGSTNLYAGIVDNGCVVSEYFPGSKPYPANFPARNRIISGLADAVFVVEAAAGSGTLITVDFALEQGKDIFALPGNVGQKNSEGTNRLIQQGAKLVTQTADILEEMDLCIVRQGEQLKDRDELIELIGQRILAFDDLLDESGLSVEALQSRLIMLELSGKISRQGNVIFLSSSR